jgi:hypothetical protein
LKVLFRVFHAVLFQILLLSLSVVFLSGPGHGINA